VKNETRCLGKNETRCLVKNEMSEWGRVDFLPPPPRRRANKDADRQAILIGTAHRPNAALRPKRRVLWGLRTPIPPRRKAMLAVTVRPLPPQRVNIRLVLGTPPRQHAKMSYPPPPGGSNCDWCWEHHTASTPKCRNHSPPGGSTCDWRWDHHPASAPQSQWAEYWG
jgi:hypothetical protein